MRMIHKRVTVSWFSIRLGAFISLFFIPQLLMAQEKNDSIWIFHEGALIKPKVAFPHSKLELFPETNTTYSLYSPDKPIRLPRPSPNRSIRIPYQINPSLLFQGDYRTSGTLHQFAHGTLFGSGSQTSLAGIGRFNNASLGYRHVFDERFELQLRANAMKINMSHITGQTFSTSGAFLYHPSDYVTFKVFGSYDIGNSYGMSTNRYGATMSIDMTDRFGMEMGVQRYYDAMSRRWETVPVVIPYYRFNKFTLGIDAGAIIYEILRNAVFDTNRGMNNGPTIGPPQFRIPIK